MGNSSLFWYLPEDTGRKRLRLDECQYSIAYWMVQYVLRLGLDSGFQCNSLPDVVVDLLQDIL
jgi:hypothetical protein